MLVCFLVDKNVILNTEKMVSYCGKAIKPYVFVGNGQEIPA